MYISVWQHPTGAWKATLRDRNNLWVSAGATPQAARIAVICAYSQRQRSLPATPEQVAYWKTFVRTPFEIAGDEATLQLIDPTAGHWGGLS